jgi:hypothetical protein
VQAFFQKCNQNLAHGFSGNYSCKRGNLPHRRKRPKELRHYDCGEANGEKNKEFFPLMGSAKRPVDFFSRPELGIFCIKLLVLYLIWS